MFTTNPANLHLDSVFHFTDIMTVDIMLLEENKHGPLTMLALDGEILDTLLPSDEGWNVTSIRNLFISIETRSNGYEILLNGHNIGSSEM